MTPTTAAPRRPKLDREVVVDAALAVADAEGLEAVTIRRLAENLGVTPMALYWHFKDKEALLAATADRMWGQTLAELDAGGALSDWASLRRILEAMTTVMRRHPAVAALTPSRVVECPAGLALTERTLCLLAEQGFDARRAAAAARFVLCSAVMLVDNQPGAKIAEPTERDDAQRRKRIALASLPPDRYPYTMAAADYLTDCSSPDSYFEEGIELVVAGVRSQVLHRVSSKRSDTAGSA